MAGKKGRSGRKSKREENLDTMPLRRYSMAHLLMIMRAKPGSFFYDAKLKSRVALEVISKELSKPVQIDNSKHTHVVYVWGEDEQPSSTFGGGEGRIDSLQAPRLPEGSSRESE